MNTTSETTEVIEDIPMDVPEGTDYESIPAGMYNARLIGLKIVPKPDWLIKGEEGENLNQLQWTFELIDGEYAGLKLADFCNITFHPKATAHKHAAALLGVPELPAGAGMSTKILAGKVGQLWVVEKQNKKGEMRNYVDKVTALPSPRNRPQRAPQPSQSAVKRVSVPGLGDGMYDPENDGDMVEF